MKKKVVEVASPVVVRLPKRMIAVLDKEAGNNCRSRSSEIRSRLVASLGLKVRP